MLVRDVLPGDAVAIARIYNHYVRTSIITFEEEEIEVDGMERRIRDVVDAKLPWLVCEREAQVVGYAYAGKWKARAAYRYSFETTVYADPAALGQGIGRSLYEELFRRLALCGANAVIGGIALPNPASVALHESFGMKKVAHFERVGFKFGRWIDVAYWQFTLQRGATPDWPADAAASR